MTDSAGTNYTTTLSSLYIEDQDEDVAVLSRHRGGSLVMRAERGIYISDPREFIKQVGKFAGLEVVIWPPEPESPEPSEPKRPHDFAFDVAPKIQAIKVTEEYARSGIFNSASKVAPKYDERRGTLLGVEVRGEDGGLTGRVAEVGDYLVSTPTGVEVVWGHVFEDNYRKVSG